jgi:hypothetical protein
VGATAVKLTTWFLSLRLRWRVLLTIAVFYAVAYAIVGVISLSATQAQPSSFTSPPVQSSSPGFREGYAWGADALGMRGPNQAADDYCRAGMRILASGGYDSDFLHDFSIGCATSATP